VEPLQGELARSGADHLVVDRAAGSVAVEGSWGGKRRGTGGGSVDSSAAGRCRELDAGSSSTDGNGGIAGTARGGVDTADGSSRGSSSKAVRAVGATMHSSRQRGIVRAYFVGVRAAEKGGGTGGATS
jgi:hypothetical protein